MAAIYSNSSGRRDSSEPNTYRHILDRCIKPKGTCPPCQRLSDIEGKIEDARRTLDRLLEERESMIPALNQYHDPLINHLPVEVASRVFVHCKPMPPSAYDPDATYEEKQLIRDVVTLGQVCRNWRRIAQSTPELWNTLCTTITPGRCVSSVDTLSEWLQRSGALPLFLQIFVFGSYPGNKTYNDAVKQVISAFILHAHRWEVLDLDIPSSFLPWMSAALSNKNMSGLHHIRAAVFTEDDDEVLHLDSSPRWLTYESGLISHINVDQKQLTHVYIHCIETFDAIELFRSAPLLEYCKISEVADVVGHSSTEPLVVVPSLVSLHIHTFYGEFWDHFLFPSLTTLDASPCFDESIPSSWVRLRALLRRSGCKIQALMVDEVEGWHDDLVEVFRLTPDLGQLSMSGSVISNHLFSAMEAAATTKGKMEPTQFLNKLQSLSFDSDKQNFDWTSLFAFLISVASRPEHSLRSFALKTSIVTGGDIEAEVDKDMFKHMMDATFGLQLSIFHDDENLVDKLRHYHDL